MELPWRLVGVGDGPMIGTSLTADEAATLRDLATGKRVLEVGSAYGFSAITMAQTAKHVLAVDPHLDWLPDLPEHNSRDSLTDMRALLNTYGCTGKVTIALGFSQDVLPALAATHATFDLIFIDGDHGYDTVRADVTNALPLLAPGGVLACHDYGESSCPDVKVALDELYPDGPDRLVDTVWIRACR